MVDNILVTITNLDLKLYNYVWQSPSVMTNVLKHAFITDMYLNFICFLAV